MTNVEFHVISVSISVSMAVSISVSIAVSISVSIVVSISVLISVSFQHDTIFYISLAFTVTFQDEPEVPEDFSGFIVLDGDDSEAEIDDDEEENVVRFLRMYDSPVT